MSPGAAASLNAREQSTHAKGNAVPASVLIVDDTKALHDVVEIVAKRAGLTVCAWAENGRDGVDAARTHQPDAVILDQEMPEMDGVTALPLIRDAAPEAVVVMFSSSDDRAVIEAALHGGAAAYFRKGVDTVDQVVAFLCERVRCAA